MRSGWYRSDENLEPSPAYALDRCLNTKNPLDRDQSRGGARYVNPDDTSLWTGRQLGKTCIDRGIWENVCAPVPARYIEADYVIQCEYVYFCRGLL